MDFSSLDPYTLVDIFLLLLIGIGPKIALVPFLDATSHASVSMKAATLRKMLTTAATVALILVIFGGLLTRLLHFSTGALAIAGGMILLIIAASMVLSQVESRKNAPASQKSPLEQAIFPLAIPYLLNPAGIVVLVTVSAEAGSVGVLATVIALVIVVLLIDIAVFRWANEVSSHLDESRMLVVEKVFGFLLAALAVQLVLGGLDAVGVVHLIAH